MFHTNSQQLSAKASFPLRHINTRWHHRKTSVADDSCAGSHLEPWNVQSIPYLNKCFIIYITAYGRSPVCTQ